MTFEKRTIGDFEVACRRIEAYYAARSPCESGLGRDATSTEASP